MGRNFTDLAISISVNIKNVFVFCCKDTQKYSHNGISMYKKTKSEGEGVYYILKKEFNIYEKRSFNIYEKRGRFTSTSFLQSN